MRKKIQVTDKDKLITNKTLFLTSSSKTQEDVDLYAAGPVEDYGQTETPYSAKLLFKTEQEVQAFQNKDQLRNL